LTRYGTLPDLRGRVGSECYVQGPTINLAVVEVKRDELDLGLFRLESGVAAPQLDLMSKSSASRMS
jgi:hypothetical protein